ncbi:MAG TPA: rhodanese-like domain-containing protein, partial [Casimicrobiaceae bacterium]|nr:rhodanese-like domain-containing protein [Casimicrobiaceae bacterium]
TVETGARRKLDPPSPASMAAAAARSRELALRDGVQEIDAGMLRELMNGDTNRYVFDVRSLADYASGHIAGTIALPGGQAVQRTDDFVAVQHAPIVLVDAHGVQAYLTGMWLRRMGHTDVSVLAGGIHAWRKAGGGLQAGRGRATPRAVEAARGVTECLSPETFAQECDGAALVIDVDTSRHFREGHVPRAQWMPRGSLEQRIGELAPAADTQILVSCESGVQASLAAATLRRLGFARVAALDGGTRAWAAAGLALETASLHGQADELLPPYMRGEQAMRDYIAWETQLVR